MQNFLGTLSQFYDNATGLFGMPDISFSFVDIVEILIISFLFYHILLWIKNTRAWNLFKGIIVILLFVLVAAIFQMNTILWLAENTLSVGLTALVIIFQPELRKALENLGGKNVLGKLFDFGKVEENKFSDHTIDELIKACYAMGKVKTGALIVIEDEILLNEYVRTGIDIDASYDFDVAATPVELPGGIVMGKSNFDDIKAAYGDPSDTYEGDLYTKYSYSKDYYEEVHFYVYKDDNTLKQVDMRNFVEPEGYDKGSVSEEVPEIVSSYTAPTELGDDLLAPQLEFCGDLYSLPAPVSAFLENGWELQDVEDGAYVAGRDLEFVDMMKNNQSVHFSVYNFTQDATAIENCFVRELEVGNYDSDALTLTLSGGFTLGAKKADLIAAAEEKGYACDEDGDYLNIYKSADTKIDNRAQFWFNKDEDPDTVASVAYRNEILPE